MTGNLLGASLSGLIGDFLGWRGVLAVLGSLAIAASLAVAIGFRRAALVRRPAKIALAVFNHGYHTIFAHPHAVGCFLAVFVRGCCLLRLFPSVAAFFVEPG